MSSRGVNKVILIGNVGQDPEVRFTPSGVAIANVRLATSESWKDQSGQLQERTEWHRVVMYRRLAEIVGEYVKKGSKIYIEGKLTTRKWQDKDGQDRYTTEVTADEMQMLDGRQSDQMQGGDQEQQRGGGQNYPQGGGQGQQRGGGQNQSQGGGQGQQRGGGQNYPQGGNQGQQRGGGQNYPQGGGQGQQRGGGQNYPQGGGHNPPLGGGEPTDFDDDIPFGPMRGMLV